MGNENDRFARALQDEWLRQRLVAEYAWKSKACGWAAILQGGVALVLYLIPSTRPAHVAFLCVALGFLLLCFRLRSDRKRLQCASQCPDCRPPAVS